MYDAIVIGGGITGAGIARDCALRGLKTVVFEKSQPGHATTAASTHLIHGGLRYLLYDRLTTHTTCWDSGNIVRIARPLLTRLPILWPVYERHRHGIETVETLMESYDSFSRMKEGVPHLRFSAGETLKLVPGLKREGLVGSVSFDEWWVDPIALVNANLKSAADSGCEIRAGCGVTTLLTGDEKGPQSNRGVQTSGRQGDEKFAVTGVEFTDDSGRKHQARGKLVINAAGPWVDRVARMAGTEVPLRLRKGTHLVYDRHLLKSGSDPRPMGLLVEAEDRERYVFIISVGSTTLIGPTDLSGPDNPDELATSEDEIRYLLASTRLYFPEFPEKFNRTIVGARPILGQAGSEKLLSREYEIIDHERLSGVSGFLTAAGGKMSDFRLMAQDAVDAACRKLGIGASCRTADVTLADKELPFLNARPRPAPWLKHFLRYHPYLREVHAVAYLGAAYGGHLLRRLSMHRPTATMESFASHYYRSGTPV